MPVIKVMIREDQRKWLATHPMINFCGFVQQIIQEEQKKPSPFFINKYTSVRLLNDNRAVGKTVSISEPDKLWIDDIRAKRANKRFLSIYVQMQLDNFIKVNSAVLSQN